MVQSERFSQIYDRIIRDLEREKIFILNETQLNEEQGRFVKAFYEKSLRSKLMPIILSNKRELPDLRDAMIYLAVELRTKGEKENLSQDDKKILKRVLADFYRQYKT